MTKVATNTKLTSTKEYMQWVLLAHIYDFIDDVILQRRISPYALVFRSPRENLIKTRLDNIAENKVPLWYVAQCSPNSLRKAFCNVDFVSTLVRLRWLKFSRPFTNFISRSLEEVFSSDVEEAPLLVHRLFHCFGLTLSGAHNVNSRKASVRKAIWDLEFPEHLL